MNNALRELGATLFDELRRMSADRGGVTRPAYSMVETRAHALIAKAAKYNGLDVWSDAVGNTWVGTFGLYGEKRRGERAVVMGSHLDSVPCGGNFDGAAGIVAGLCCLIRARAEGVAAPLRVVALRGEESAWFGVPHVGAKALLGEFTDAKDLTARHRDTGVMLAAVVADVGGCVTNKPLAESKAIKAFLELHIEQGPVLVQRAQPIAAVSSIWGSRRHKRVRFTGEAAHSGAQPQTMRKDAVMAAARFLVALDDTARAWGSRTVTVTAGTIATDPTTHSLTRVPDVCDVGLEVRGRGEDVAHFWKVAVEDEAAWIAKEHNVAVDFDEAAVTPGADMSLFEACHVAVTRTINGEQSMASGAGHDASVFARVGIPTGMIFVRNEGGSHNPGERMSLDDWALGCDALYEAAVLAHKAARDPVR